MVLFDELTRERWRLHREVIVNVGRKPVYGNADGMVKAYSAMIYPAMILLLRFHRVPPSGRQWAHSGNRSKVYLAQ